VLIQAVHAEVKARYGSPRMHAELLDRGHDCCVNTVARIMREAGIAAKTKRKYRHTTDSNHSQPVAENLLDRQFDPAAPNEKWVADMTYIATREGWLYLAVVEDLFSQMVVGWSMDAMSEKREPPEGVYGAVPQGPCDVAKAILLESESPAVQPHTRRHNASGRRHRERTDRVSQPVTSARWAMGNDPI